MSLAYRFLTEASLPEVYRTFVAAFSDYAIDISYLTEEKLGNRAIKNGIAYDASVGVFENGRMVGFTLVGSGRRTGLPSAFDIGTGIIPSHRGRGIARGMFDFAVPRLKEKGIKKFYLEVLQNNEPAVRAYEKTGFRIRRELDCFELPLKNADFYRHQKPPFDISFMPKRNITRFSDFQDWEPSWENSFDAVLRVPDRIWLFCAGRDGADAGYIVYYPALNWIMNMAVGKPYRRQGLGTLLVEKIARHPDLRLPSIRLVNVPREDRGMAGFLKKNGFDIFASQFEMVFDIL
jgi:ribosomal protein S18 acetylase RimI-like enzyme